MSGGTVFTKKTGTQGGGVLLAVHKNIPSSPLHVITPLEVVACSVFYNNFSISICNIYLPEHAQVTADTLGRLFSSIPEPRLILGDFNARHVSWGSPLNCPRGIIITDSLLEHDLIVLNDGSPTRYDRFQDNYSHIDVSCCSTSVCDKLNWEVMDNLYTSDHFPIHITSSLNNLYVEKPIKYKLSEANWVSYRANVLLPDVYQDADIDYSLIITALLSAAAIIITKTRPIINTKYNAL